MASPSVITLNIPTCIDILSKYVELAQQKGAFLLKEAELLKRASDILNDVEKDNSLSKGDCLNILIQGVNKGQQSGSYTLTDAALIWRVLEYLQQVSQQQAQQSSLQQEQQTNPVKVQQDDVDDLSSLSEPIPFKVI